MSRGHMFTDDPPTVDPNERGPGTCDLGDPRVVNIEHVGPALG